MASSLLQALVPLFFVLALGYAAGRFHSFDADQATGFNTLLVEFALPAMLFSSTVTIKRPELLREGPVVLALVVAYVGVFLLAFGVYRWWGKRSGAEASLAGLLLASPAAPFFGPAVVTPLYGAESGLMIAIVALVINVTQVPLGIVLIGAGGGGKAGGSVLSTVLGSFKQPVVIAPLVALALVLAGVTLPLFAEDALKLIGSATGGVAVFASGLTLAAHKLSLGRDVWANTLGKLVLLPAVVLGLLTVFGVTGPSQAQAVVVSAISSGLIGLILASRYKTYVDQAASTVLISAIGMAVALPLWILLLPKS